MINSKMILFKKYWKRFSMIIISLIILSGSAWIIWDTNNIGLNKEHLLRKNVQKYSDLIEIGLFDQAFNLYLTPDAKSKTIIGYRDIEPTDQEKEQQKKDCEIQEAKRLFKSIDWCGTYFVAKKNEPYNIPANEVFSKYAQERKNNWRNIKINKIVFSESGRADVILNEQPHNNAPTETWYFQNGQWLRDF